MANGGVSDGEGVLAIAGGDRMSVLEGKLGKDDDDDRGCGPCSRKWASSRSGAQRGADGEGMSCML